MSAGTQVNSQTFEPPPGYSEIVEFSEEQLFIEDLNNDDKELWLFQAPQDLDFIALKNRDMSMEGETVFQNSDCLMSEKCHKMSVFRKAESKLADYQLMLPSRSNSGWFLAPLPFAGQVNLMEYFNRPPRVSLYSSPQKEKKNISDLRRRYSSFGSGEPLATPKLKTLVKSNSSSEYASTETPASAKKKVTFKTPLTETQKHVVPKVANNSDQEISVSPLDAVFKKASKQKALRERETFQENESPDKAKPKKRKHNSFPNESESNISSFNVEEKISHKMLYSEEMESSSDYGSDSLVDAGGSLNELPYNNGSEDNSAMQRKTKRKREAEKSSISDCGENEGIISKNKNLCKNIEPLQGSSPTETTENSEQGIYLQGTGCSNLTNQKASLENYNSLYDNSHKKLKKKKKKSKESTGCLTSKTELIPKVQPLETSSLIELSGESPLLEADDSGCRDSKHLLKLKKKAEKSSLKDKSIDNNKQNASQDAQHSHKTRKRKKEPSQSNSPQDDRKCKKRKPFDHLQENDSSEPGVSSFFQKYNKSDNFKQAALCSNTKDATIVRRNSLEDSSHPGSVKHQNINPSGNKELKTGKSLGNGSFQTETSILKKKKKKEFGNISNRLAEMDIPLTQCEEKNVFTKQEACESETIPLEKVAFNLHEHFEQPSTANKEFHTGDSSEHDSSQTETKLTKNKKKKKKEHANLSDRLSKMDIPFTLHEEKNVITKQDACENETTPLEKVKFNIHEHFGQPSANKELNTGESSEHDNFQSETKLTKSRKNKKKEHANLIDRLSKMDIPFTLCEEKNIITKQDACENETTPLEKVTFNIHEHFEQHSASKELNTGDSSEHKSSRTERKITMKKKKRKKECANTSDRLAEMDIPLAQCEEKNVIVKKEACESETTPLEKVALNIHEHFQQPSANKELNTGESSEHKSSRTETKVPMKKKNKKEYVNISNMLTEMNVPLTEEKMTFIKEECESKTVPLEKITLNIKREVFSNSEDESLSNRKHLCEKVKVKKEIKSER